MNQIIRYTKRILNEFIPSRFRIQTIVNSYVSDKCSNIVVNGPFKGQLNKFASIPRLLGTWEKELHPVVNEIINQNYDCIINVGSHEGY